MRLEDRDDFEDLVAQAVIDRIEERDRVNRLVDMVVARVFELKRLEVELQAAVQTNGHIAGGATTVIVPEQEELHVGEEQRADG
jgi:hypothetical protein